MMQNDNKLVARSIRFDIATGRSNDFHTLFQNEVLPILRKQDGFKDEMLLTNGDHVVAISLWTNADSAKKYETTTYSAIEQKLRPIMTGSPTVETYKYNSLLPVS